MIGIWMSNKHFIPHTSQTLANLHLDLVKCSSVFSINTFVESSCYWTNFTSLISNDAALHSCHNHGVMIILHYLVLMRPVHTLTDPLLLLIRVCGGFCTVWISRRDMTENTVCLILASVLFTKLIWHYLIHVKKWWF